MTNAIPRPTSAKLWRFGIPRRRKSPSKAREVRIEPTPETLAKRKFPVWNQPGRAKDGTPLVWPSELQMAAFQIDLAVRLLAGAGMCQAQDLLHVARMAASDWTHGQSAVVRRYNGWCALMASVGWPLQPVLDAVVHGAEPADEWLLRRALHLHATGQVLSGGGAK